MSKLVKLIGNGVGIVSEYRASRQPNSGATSGRASENTSPAGPSGQQQTRDLYAPPGPSNQQYTSDGDDAPPVYAKVPDEQADRLIQSGQAVPVNERPGYGYPADKKSESGYVDDSDEDDSDDDINSSIYTRDTSREEYDDEKDWELDEAALPPSYEESETEQPRSMNELVGDVFAGHTMVQQTARLPCPVIIPQRRPRQKTRGFVRAYAPVLNDCGIDQDTFLRFLKSFHQASQANPIWTVLQVSAGIAGMAPSVIAMAVTTAVQIAAGAAKEVQTRARTNNYLDQMNEQLFKPRGLYALIFKYKPDQTQSRFGGSGPTVSAESIDVMTGRLVAKYDRSDSGVSQSSGLMGGMANLRVASGDVRGLVEMPQAAPLIFPDLDRAIEQQGQEGFKAKMKGASKFLGDYLDRRAQAKSVDDDPLNIEQPAPKFASKYADPNHPANSGDLAALVTGGKYNLSELKGGRREQKYERKAERRERKDDRRIRRGKSPRGDRRDDWDYDDRSGRMGGGPLGGRGRGFGGGRGGGFGGGLLGGRGRGSGGGLGGLIGGLGDRLGAEIGGRADRLGGGRDGPRDDFGRDRDAGRDMAYSRDGYGEQDMGYGGRRSGRRGGGRRNRRRQNGGPIKRMMRQDVLYLLIVNLPSDEELLAAREQLAREKSR